MQGTSATCKRIIDLGFILDSSGSLRDEYHKEKEFMNLMADAFDINSNGSQASVITFSYSAEHSIKLGQHSDVASFQKDVNAIPLMGYTTRIDKALKLARDDMFNTENGGREDVPKMLILLTDGSQTQDADAEDPALFADEIRSKGISLLVVGIGRGVNMAELSRMAGGEGNVFTADSFDQLIREDFVEKLVAGSCSKIEKGIPF